MSASIDFRIAVLAGDGIGHEVMPPALQVLTAVVRRIGGFSLTFDPHQAGAEMYRDVGHALPRVTLDACRRADAILLGAMGLPHIRYPDGTEIAPQLDLRVEFGLYAGVRPIRAIPGVPGVIAHPRAKDIELVIVRESTEGLFASRGRGIVENDREARDTLVITRATSERLFDFSFRLAQSRGAGAKRERRVTCVDKANVFKSFAFFRSIFDERAKAFPEISADHIYIDAAALQLVLAPWNFDVLVTENMFGDILSDLGAGLIGGMGYAPSADVGDSHAVFQPCHGTAPDIAGSGRANPTAMVLSAAMMLEWLGEKHGVAEAGKTGVLIRSAVDHVFATGRLRTCEAGGNAGTTAVTAAILEAIDEVAHEQGLA